MISFEGGGEGMDWCVARALWREAKNEQKALLQFPTRDTGAHAMEWDDGVDDGRWRDGMA